MFTLLMLETQPHDDWIRYGEIYSLLCNVFLFVLHSVQFEIALYYAFFLMQQLERITSASLKPDRTSWLDWLLV
jgi:hypothetical protein